MKIQDKSPLQERHLCHFGKADYKDNKTSPILFKETKEVIDMIYFEKQNVLHKYKDSNKNQIQVMWLIGVWT